MRFRFLLVVTLLTLSVLSPMAMCAAVDVSPAPASQVDTFFSSELGQVILTSVGSVAAAAFSAFVGTNWYRTRTNIVTRKIAGYIANAVATTYVTKVRDWKALSDTGDLTAQQKTEAENASMSLVRSAAAEDGLDKHPLVANSAMLRGAIVNAVATAKRPIATHPTTKGA